MGLIHEIDFGTPASASEKQVTLTVDGRTITVPEGTSIMRASMEAGVEIPKLCATDMVDAFGSCRICLVEIEGRGGTPASCTTPVGEGMVVHTQIGPAERDPARRDGALCFRPSARLGRTGGHRRQRVRPGRGVVGLTEIRYGTEGRNHVAAGQRLAQHRLDARATNRTPISPTIRRSASSARAAYAPARRCRAPSR